MLSAHAPRAWAKRVLCWQIFLGELGLYFTAGTIVHNRSPTIMALEAAEGKEPADLATLIDQYGEELGRAVQAALPLGRVVIQMDDWVNEARHFPVELMIHADDLDWEEGILSIELINGIHEWDGDYPSLYFEHDDEYLQVDLKEMCFSLEVIEMLAPNGRIPTRDELPATVTNLGDGGARKGGPGRRREYDWDGALFHLIGEAEKNSIAPDPNAHGAQADIKRKLADWFSANGGKVPAESQLQSYASRALDSIRNAKP